MIWLILWLIALAAFLVVEATHARILGLWYAIGAASGAIAAAAGLPVWAQFLIAVPVAAVSFWLLRPLARKFYDEANRRLRLRRLVGRHGIVSEEVSSSSQAGKIEIDGELIAASPKSRDLILPVGSRATVVDVRGECAIVRLSHRQNKGGITHA